MAVTITRSVWVDDDGTGQTGTVINQALHTTLYNEIDTALAKVPQLAGGNTFTGNQTITGLLTLNAQGAHTVNNYAVGPLQVMLRNFAGGGTNSTQVGIGNDASATTLTLTAFATTFTTAGMNVADGATIAAAGSAGLSLGTVAAASMRCYTTNAERLRILATGEVLINTGVNVGAGQLTVVSDQAHSGFIVQNTNPANGMTFAAFLNSTNGIAGVILQTSATTVAFNTSSDARLKDDGGRAEDLSALRAVIVHDFTWKADGVRDRGIFAQDAHALYPRAVSPGTDDMTDNGSLARPWMTDYSKFVPDLIVGWQQHDAEIAELRAMFAAVKG
jgi:hypothetical protein